MLEHVWEAIRAISTLMLTLINNELTRGITIIIFATRPFIELIHPYL